MIIVIKLPLSSDELKFAIPSSNKKHNLTKFAYIDVRYKTFLYQIAPHLL